MTTTSETGFPIAWTIQLLPYLAGARDSHNNPTPDWGDPIDYPIYGWSPSSSSEPFEEGRHAVVTTLQVYAPPENPRVSPQDRMVIKDRTYTVEGIEDDYNHGPFDWAPGIVINLRRVSEGGQR